MDPHLLLDLGDDGRLIRVRTTCPPLPAPLPLRAVERVPCRAGQAIEPSQRYQAALHVAAFATTLHMPGEAVLR